MDSYALRITMPIESLREVCDSLAKQMKSLIAVEHSDDATRVHCHFALVECTVSKVQLRRIIQQHLPPGSPKIGNTFWSWKRLDIKTLDKYVCYMSKGVWDPSALFGEYDYKRYCKAMDLWCNYRSADRVETVTKGHQGYLDFKEKMLQYDVEIRRNYEDIHLLAHCYCKQKHGWFSQVCNNEILNYTKTFCFDYQIKKRQQV